MVISDVQVFLMFTDKSEGSLVAEGPIHDV